VGADQADEGRIEVGIPLVLVTSDGGIASEGLWAAAEALLSIGEVLVVAPERQGPGSERSMPSTATGESRPYVREIDGQRILGYAVDASPARAVRHGVLELARRKPSLVVSGINYGYTLAKKVTISGTVRAALEGAALGIPAMAISLEMDPGHHLRGDGRANYAAAKAFVERFALHLLSYPLTYDADVLNINLPADATPDTPWRLTRLARERHPHPQAPNRTAGQGQPGYTVLADPTQTRLDSDVWAAQVDRVVSVTPLSLGLTARTICSGWKASARQGLQEAESASRGK
jgi:5'-nucleotidase